MTKDKDYGTRIPKHEIESLARCFLPQIQEFFGSEEGIREYEEFIREQAETSMRTNKDS